MVRKTPNLPPVDPEALIDKSPQHQASFMWSSTTCAIVYRMANETEPLLHGVKTSVREISAAIIEAAASLPPEDVAELIHQHWTATNGEVITGRLALRLVIERHDEPPL